MAEERESSFLDLVPLLRQSELSPYSRPELLLLVLGDACRLYEVFQGARFTSVVDPQALLCIEMVAARLAASPCFSDLSAMVTSSMEKNSSLAADVPYF